MLELRNVNTFYGNIQALRDVNIRINEGEIVTLIGANGAGKSTTRSGRTKSWRSASARCRKAV